MMMVFFFLLPRLKTPFRIGKKNVQVLKFTPKRLPFSGICGRRFCRRKLPTIFYTRDERICVINYTRSTYEVPMYVILSFIWSNFFDNSSQRQKGSRLGQLSSVCGGTKWKNAYFSRDWWAVVLAVVYRKKRTRFNASFETSLNCSYSVEFYRLWLLVRTLISEQYVNGRWREIRDLITYLSTSIYRR